MAGRISGLSVAYVTGGLLLVISGYQNVSLATTIKDLAQGKLPVGKPTGPIQVGLQEIGGGWTSADQTAAAQELGTNAPGGTVSKNQAIAKMLAAPYGWSTGTQWTDLVALWNKESSWSNTAENPSGAYGIPQALPATKMPKSAQPPSDGGSSNATAQISWGLSYIKSTYGSPSAAWAHEEANNWY